MQNQSVNQPMAPVEWGLLIGLSVIWGGSFFLNAVLVAELPTLTIVAARVVIAAIVLWGVMRAMRLPIPTDPALWGAFAVMGVLNNAVPFSLIVWGQTHVASGVASIFNATTPLFTVLVAHGFTQDEKVTGLRLFGVLAGLAGVAVMIGAEAVDALDGVVWGQLAFIGAAISYACAVVYGRRFKKDGISPVTTATGQVTCSGIVMAVAACWVDLPWQLPMPGAEAWGALFFLGALCTGVAYLMYFRILAGAGATNASIVTFLVPVSAILLGVTVLGEALQARHLLGMGLIALGLAAIDGRLFKRRSH